jgi:hypothetical protein
VRKTQADRTVVTALWWREAGGTERKMSAMWTRMEQAMST